MVNWAWNKPLYFAKCLLNLLPQECPRIHLVLDLIHKVYLLGMRVWRMETLTELYIRFKSWGIWDAMLASRTRTFVTKTNITSLGLQWGQSWREETWCLTWRTCLTRAWGLFFGGWWWLSDIPCPRIPCLMMFSVGAGFLDYIETEKKTKQMKFKWCKVWQPRAFTFRFFVASSWLIRKI